MTSTLYYQLYFSQNNMNFGNIFPFQHYYKIVKLYLISGNKTTETAFSLVTDIVILCISHDAFVSALTHDIKGSR